MRRVITTALESHGDVDPSAKESYGQGRVILRIGNGGAGATGLIKALADDYLSTLISRDDGSIQWVCNHSRNSQLALLHGHVDIALTYERDQEDLAAAEGWSVTAGCAFHDHFVLAGPASDPAHIRTALSVEEAFSKIATAAKYLFHSRADASATMWKERSIWAKSGVTPPWSSDSSAAAAGGWYQTSQLSPAEALTTADAAGAYLLIDRSTLLRQTALQTIHNTTVFFEPSCAEDLLMNSCYALIPAPSSAQRADNHNHRNDRENAYISDFLKYLFSPRGQSVIGSFGKEELGGFALFAPVADGFARSFLKGGLPRCGKWEMDKKSEL